MMTSCAWTAGKRVLDFSIVGLFWQRTGLPVTRDWRKYIPVAFNVFAIGGK